jgi:MFS family permease
MKKFLVSYFLFGCFFFSFFSSGFMDSQDGLQYLAIARRIYYDNTLAMPESNYDDRTNIHFNTYKKDDGTRYSPTGLGYSLALLPAVAIEDILLKSLNLEPIEAFPLENDWPVLLFASMTNSVFGALFIVSFYYYLRLLDLNHKNSFLLSFILFISSNIFIYSKHTFAHMMFVSFMFLSFVFVKKFFIYKKYINLFIAGIMFGIMLLSYNSTYMFILPAIFLYIFFLSYKRKIDLKKLAMNFFIFISGIIPFYLLNFWFTTITGSATAVKQVDSTLGWIKPYVFIEGFWGILFSPGKSIFLYSPIIVIFLIFWHKINIRKYKAELVTGIVLFLTYLFFIGTLMGAEDYLLWHGDSSFGNRYMLATLPFILVYVAIIFSSLSKKFRLFVFFPFLIISIFVQIVGISQPYQIRFAGLQQNVEFNGRNFNMYEYGNIIPRYSPLFSMSKKLVRKILDIKLSFQPEHNKVSFYDGFGYPFGSKNNYLRSMEETALLKVPINSKVSLKVINHQINQTSSHSAKIKTTNGFDTNLDTIKAGEEKIIEINTLDNTIIFNKYFIGTSSASIPKDQVVFVNQVWVNDNYQNLNTIDYPYVSEISQALTNQKYTYWGAQETDPWSIWHMHSGVYEKTFDFWWLRPFQYWDLPKGFFLGLFIFNFSGCLHFAYLTLESSKKVN